MTDNPLDRFGRQRDFLIGIDSDGCAFDTMEIKHKECFIPNFIKHMGLQPVSKYAREACEFVNLYSRSRGVNRFPAYLKALDLLAGRPEVGRRAFRVPPLPGLRGWVERETRLGNPVLKAEADARYVIITVGDTGVGVAPEEQDLVFQKFRQSGNPLTREHAGTGLGLSICRELIDGHDGRLTASPGAHGGTVFTIALPA